MTDDKPVGLTEMLELMKKNADRLNAKTIHIKGHKCKNLDGYCYAITVCSKEECEECRQE